MKLISTTEGGRGRWSGKISRRAINWKNRGGRAFTAEGTAFAKAYGLDTAPWVEEHSVSLDSDCTLGSGKGQSGDRFANHLRFQLQFIFLLPVREGDLQQGDDRLQRRREFSSSGGGKFYRVCGGDWAWGMRASVTPSSRFVDWVIWAPMIAFKDDQKKKMRSKSGG